MDVVDAHIGERNVAAVDDGIEIIDRFADISITGGAYRTVNQCRKLGNRKMWPRRELW